MPLQPLTPSEREILETAAIAGGRFTIAGLWEGEMLRVATTVVELKRRGLVKSLIQFSRETPGQPEAIPVELTPEGERALGRI
jgi:hypothetical protein